MIIDSELSSTFFPAETVDLLSCKVSPAVKEQEQKENAIQKYAKPVLSSEC